MPAMRTLCNYYAVGSGREEEEKEKDLEGNQEGEENEEKEEEHSLRCFDYIPDEQSTALF